MSWRATLLWWIAAVVAVGAALAVAAKAPVGVGTALRPLLDERWRPEQIEMISLERPGRPTIVLERHDQGWIEREPSGLAADPFQVQNALAAAGALRVSREIPVDGAGAAESRRAMGLDRPEAIVVLGGHDGATTLRLGRRGVAGRAFIEIADPSGAAGVAAVVGQELHDALLGADPSQWRLRSLFPDAGAATSAIGFEAGRTSLRLVRRGPRWMMESPVATRVDPVAAAAYVDALARSECAGFLDDITDESRAALDRFGLAEPPAQLRVASEDGAERRLLVGATIGVGGGDRFGMLAGHRAIMRLGAAALQAIFVNPATLIDPTASGVVAADVKSIVISGPQGRFSLVRDLDRWVSPEADGAAASIRAVDELLRRLTIARAGSIALQPVAGDRLVGRVELRGFDGSTLAAIDIAGDDARANVALDAGDGVARVFPASQAPELSPAAYGLRSR